MLLRALALYVILNSIFLATESQRDRIPKEGGLPKDIRFTIDDLFPKKDNLPKDDRISKDDLLPKKNNLPIDDRISKEDDFHKEHHFFPSNNKRDCYVIRDSNGDYLSVNHDRKLVLDRNFENTLSTFRFEATGQVNRQGFPVYEIINCGSNKPISWSKLLKQNDLNYFVYAKNSRLLVDNFSWIVVGQEGSKFVQILYDNGVFNLHSSSTKEEGKRLALVYGARWPDSFSQEENNRPFWTIEIDPTPVIGARPLFRSIVLDAEETKTSTTTSKSDTDSREEEVEEKDNKVFTGEK